MAIKLTSFLQKTVRAYRWKRRWVETVAQSREKQIMNKKSLSSESISILLVEPTT